MTEKKFSWQEALKFGWEKFKGNIGFFIGVLLVAWIVQAIPGYFEDKLKNSPDKLLYLIVVILSSLISAVVSLGLLKISLGFCDHGKAEFNDLLAGLPVFVPYIIASILCMLAVACGFILLIVPGIIVAIRLGFYPYLIIDKNMSIMDSLNTSFKITKGSVWDLFVFGFVMGVLNLLGALCLGVGLLVSIPVTMIATAFVYRKFFPSTPISQQPM